jgi:hypothetical protein
MGTGDKLRKFLFGNSSFNKNLLLRVACMRWSALCFNCMSRACQFVGFEEITDGL